MGNFFSDLFSSGGTSAVRYDTMSPEQKTILTQLLGQAQAGINDAAPTTPFQTYAGVSPLEQQYFDTASGKTTTPSNQALLNVLSGKPAYEINPEATEQYYQQSVRAPALKEFRETTMPLLAESFSGPGFWSSGRADATTKAISDLNTNLTQLHGQLLYADEQARRNALESAFGRQANAAMIAGPQETSQLAQASLYERGVRESEIQSQMARWLSGERINGQAITAYNPSTQLALSLLNAQPFAYGTNTQAPGQGGALVGAAAAAAAA